MSGFGFVETERLFDALEQGAPDLPLVVPSRGSVIAAAGVWGRYGSVVALRRDGQEGDSLLADVYLVERTLDGEWLEPDSCSGSGLPEWVLGRHDSPLPESHGSDLMNVGAQMAFVGGRRLAELTVVASRAVSTVEVRYGGDEITVPVPSGGLVTHPGLVRSPDDVAEFRGFDEVGELRSVAHYRPLTGSDREMGWPAESLWLHRNSRASPAAYSRGIRRCFEVCGQSRGWPSGGGRTPTSWPHAPAGGVPPCDTAIRGFVAQPAARSAAAGHSEGRGTFGSG